jgi:hypothetical protein
MREKRGWNNERKYRGPCMFWEGGRGGVNEQRLKVRSINISPPNSKKRE